MMLKVQQEGERQKKQLLIIFILHIYVFKDFTVIHCRCPEMVPSELPDEGYEGFMAATVKSFFPGNCLIPLVQLKRALLIEFAIL